MLGWVRQLLATQATSIRRIDASGGVQHRLRRKFLFEAIEGLGDKCKP